MGKIETIRVCTDRRTQMLGVTEEVQAVLTRSGVSHGLCYVYMPHTTAGVAINEHADPDVATDVEGAMDRLIPHKGPYRHGEGNSDAHVKTILTGVHQVIFVEDGRLVLGRWQGIFLCEYDGPRERKMQIKIVPDAA